MNQHIVPIASKSLGWGFGATFIRAPLVVSGGGDLGSVSETGKLVEVAGGGGTSVSCLLPPPPPCFAVCLLTGRSTKGNPILQKEHTCMHTYNPLCKLTSRYQE